VNFIVAPKAQFQVISEDDSQLYPGATNVPFKIIIKNTGTVAAQTIITKLLSGNSVPGVKSDSITSVGNMENIGTVFPGQTFVTTFLVNLDPNFAAGDKSTNVEIDWAQNSTNTSNVFVQTLIVPYHIANGPSYLLYYNTIPWTYIIIVMFLVVGLSIFITKRRKKIQLMESTISKEMTGIDADRLFSQDTKIPEDISAEKENNRDKAKLPPQSYFKIDDGNET
jgi:hypothetical protein